MESSLVEKYQQMLNEDPGSLVFLDLARIWIDQGEMAKAIEVCTRGVESHPESVEGRVLWGKALVGCGRPAEAMEQFDKAIEIEKDNPQAYALIGDVLLHKGLYRSAIPILRKAVALQPDNQKVREWLEQAQRSQGKKSAQPSGAPAASAGSGAPEPDSAAADAPSRAGQEPASAPTHEDPLHLSEPRHAGEPSPAAAAAMAGVGGPSGEPVSAEASSAPHAVGESASEAPSEPQAPRDAASAEMPSQPQIADKTGLAMEPDPAGLGNASGERPTLLLSEIAVPVPPSAPAAPSLLPELELPPEEDGARPPLAQDSAPESPLSSWSGPASAPTRGSGLLGDLPDEPPPDAAHGLSAPPEATEDIVREYERELRQQLLSGPPPTFWRRHWLALGGSVALLLALGVGAAVYFGMRHGKGGTDLISLRSQAFRALSVGTPASYREAIDLCHRALALSSDDEDAQAALAFAEASLFRDSGQEPSRRAEALKLLPIVQKRHPALALAIPFLLAMGPTQIEKARAPLVETPQEKLPRNFEGAIVLALAGRQLMFEGRAEEALAKFKAALDSDSGNVSTLVALGDYYASQQEHEQALKFYHLAKAASPDHVPALLGAVNSKLALGGAGANDPGPELERAEAEYRAAEASGAWPPALGIDLALARGRVLALQGKLSEAVATLSRGASRNGDRAADFLAALGGAEELGGNWDRAESAFTQALEKRPGDPLLLEELARALIAQARWADALKRTESASGDDRRLRTLRGLAYLEAGQLAKAREELAATSRNGKVPAEAAIYLAMVDAAQGQRELARQVLENAAKTSKGRAAVHVALGRLDLDEGKQKEAMAEFALAEADPRDWEGACGLGRLYLKAGQFSEAHQHLTLAVSRNKLHAEARAGLGQALIGLGEPARAKLELESALGLAPGYPAALRGLARLLLAQGKLDEARQQAQEAQRAEPASTDGAQLTGLLTVAGGNPQELLKKLERVAKTSPRDPAGYCELGETLVKLGESAAAKKAFESALKIDSENLRGRLGLVSAALPKGAKGVLKESELLIQETDQAAGPLKARAHALRARVLLALGEKEQAAAAAKRAVEADSSSADARLARGLVASAEKDDALAIEELSRALTVDPIVADAHLALAASLMRDPDMLERAQFEVDAYLRIAPKGPDAAMAKKIAEVIRKKLAD